MENILSDFLVPAFFITTAVATFIIGRWIARQKGKIPKLFGTAMIVNAVGFTIWTLAVILKPANLELFIGLGVIPLLIGHYIFLQVHLSNYKAKYQILLTTLFIALALFTFIFRSVIRPSEPYFSANGLLYFNVDEITAWLYIAIFSIARLPAILTFCTRIKEPIIRTIMSINCFTLFICSIILVSSNNDELLTINGTVMAASYFLTVTASFIYPKFTVAKTIKLT